MKYNPPYGSSNPDAPFINATPGQKGSPIPAEALEYTQREIVNAITRAGLTPSNDNLGQLYQAMQKAVAGGSYTLPPAKASVLGGVMVNKGGLQVNAAGLVSVLLATGGGLGMTSSGQLRVNPDAFSTEILNELLKTLRLPQWLTAARSWYVSPAGNDASGDGSSSNPFKTIQYAINYVSSNFNLDTYPGYIRLSSGVFDEDVTLVKYQGTTGSMYITGEGQTTLIKGSVTGAASSGSYTISDVIVQYAGRTTPGSSSYTALFLNTGSSVRISGLRIDMTNADISHARNGMWTIGGPLTIDTGCEITGRGTRAMYVLGGAINLYRDLAVNVEVASSFIQAAKMGVFATNPTANGGVNPVITGACTGKRYAAPTISIIDTGGGGPEYFPGTVAGTLSPGAQYL